MVYIFTDEIKHKTRTYADCFVERYKNLSQLEKILDITLIFTVFFGLFVLMLEHSFNLHGQIIHAFHTFDKFLVSVFVMDMGRSFYRFNNNITLFIRMHWLDIIVLSAVLLTFSLAMYIGVGRLNYLFRMQKLHKVSKFYHLTQLRKFARPLQV